MFNHNGIYAVLIGLVLIIAGMVVAAMEGNFTAGQQRRRGITVGLPVTWHAALWSDIILLPWAIAAMASYATAWSDAQMVWMLVGSTIATFLMHVWWSHNATGQECILSRDGITWCGVFHVVYMAFVLMLALLFFLYTPTDAEGYRQNLLFTVPILTTHIVIATVGVDFIKKRGKAPGAAAYIILVSCVGTIVAAVLLRNLS